jgi:hypothetical protein
VTLADLIAHQAGKPVAVIKHFRAPEPQRPEGEQPAAEKVAA